MTTTGQSIIDKVELEWPGKRLLVVGDVMLDKYVWGEVERVSPEAPVPVVRAVRNSEQPGGAANVAMNLAGLGARVTLAGFTGVDSDADCLARLLESAGVDFCCVRVASIPTISKLRVLGGRQQMLRLDVESRNSIPEIAYAELIDSAVAAVASCDAVVLSDYAKGVLNTSVCSAVIRAARQRGIPVLVDPKAADWSRYKGATTICPNLNELATALHSEHRDLDDLLTQATQLLSELELEYLVATLSERGIAVVHPAGRTLAPAVARQVFDVSGAGDTVISVLALAVTSGIDIDRAVHLANAGAGVVVSKVGTVPIQRAELLDALAATANLHADEKVLPFERLLGRVAGWRAAGETIVFTNGCFDLLHVGHITLLEQARNEGGRLIVGVNSDSSVSGLKGPSRPLVGENARAQILAALASVDAVVIFDEPTPMRLIEALRPDVLVKGGDYTEDTVVGAPEVRSWGGRVKIVRTVAGFSTTGLIQKSRA